MARGRKRKNPFDDLDTDFKSTIDNMTNEEVREKLAQVAIAEHQNIEAKKADQDLAEKQEQAKMAGEAYRECTKMNRLRTKYCYMMLESRGKL